MVDIERLRSVTVMWLLMKSLSIRLLFRKGVNIYSWQHKMIGRLSNYTWCATHNAPSERQQSFQLFKDLTSLVVRYPTSLIYILSQGTSNCLKGILDIFILHFGGWMDGWMEEFWMPFPYGNFVLLVQIWDVSTPYPLLPMGIGLRWMHSILVLWMLVVSLTVVQSSTTAYTNETL